MLPSDAFRHAWENHTITKPVVILIGGYAGTGKSTLAARLATQIHHTQIIPTGIFRSIAQTHTTPEQNSSLFLSTYDLHKRHGSNTSDIRRAFNEQCEPVTAIINSVLSFLAVEKQNLIIDGNHVLPWEHYSHPDCHIIELYMYVHDATQHRVMLGGPTHNRTIDDAQFETGRKIHAMLCSEAISNHKRLFECSEMDQAEAYVQHEIAKIIQISSNEHLTTEATAKL